MHRFSFPIISLIVVAVSWLACPQLEGQDIVTAVQQGNLKAIANAVKENPGVLKAKRNEPLMMTALRYGRTDAARKLMSLGAKVKGVNASGQSTLHFAAMYQDLDLVKELAEKLDINAVDNNGYTPLITALYYGNPTAAEALIKAGSKLSIRDRQGMSPLHIAMNTRNTKLIRLMIDQGCDMFEKNKSGMTPFMAACQSGQLDLVKEFFDLKKANEMTQHKQSCLLLACYSNSLPIVEYLCEQTDQENMKDEWGQSPLVVAVNNNNMDIVRLLLKHQADPNVTTKLDYAHPPLISATNHTNLEMVKALLKGGARTDIQATGTGDQPLHAACRSGVPPFGAPDAERVKRCAAIISALLDAGADPNAKNVAGQTPLAVSFFNNFPAGIDLLIKRTKDVKFDIGQDSLLHWACKNSMPNTVAVLLSRDKSQINQSNATGQTPLCLAAASGNLAMVNHLLAAGAKVNQAGNDGQAPILTALSSKSLPVVEALIKAGANLTLTDDGDRTPLHIAAWNGRDEAIQRLAKASVNMSPITQSGATPLHFAAWQNHTKAAAQLLTFGADIDQQDHDGWTALHKAAHRGNLKMVQYLLKRGADPDIKDSIGLTAAEKAGGTEKESILKALSR